MTTAKPDFRQADYQHCSDLESWVHLPKELSEPLIVRRRDNIYAASQWAPVTIKRFHSSSDFEVRLERCKSRFHLDFRHRNIFDWRSIYKLGSKHPQPGDTWRDPCCDEFIQGNLGYEKRWASSCIHKYGRLQVASLQVNDIRSFLNEAASYVNLELPDSPIKSIEESQTLGGVEINE